MMSSTAFRFSFRYLAAVALLIVGSACGDTSAPPAAGLTGEYVLTRVGDAALPIRGMTYGDSSYDQLDRASLRFLSRSRVKVAATTVYRLKDNSYLTEVVDSLVFEYVVKGDIAELTLRDTRGVHIDTLQLFKAGTQDALRVVTNNYAQKGWGNPLILNGYYVRPVTGANAADAPALPFLLTGVQCALLQHC